MNTNELSILIADDHPLFRGALQQVIRQLYPQSTLHEAANVAELQQQAEQNRRTDLLLLDLHMPGALGYSALSWFIGQYPQTLSLIHISEPTRPPVASRMPSSA